jgi:hypothetical protein
MEEPALHPRRLLGTVTDPPGLLALVADPTCLSSGVSGGTSAVGEICTSAYRLRFSPRQRHGKGRMRGCKERENQTKLNQHGENEKLNKLA